MVVEYKYSEQKAGPHFALQLAAYAFLIEEAWKLPVKHGLPLLHSSQTCRTRPNYAQLRKKVVQTVKQIQQIVESEIMPPPPTSQYRCVSCEFRRFCNDVV